MADNILVTVSCITYNHEKYIREALDSFLSQKTNFAFEVLVHDDASTDGTARIIREYAEKYPGVIKPILQTENQYSKGAKISATYVWPKAKGEYIALCEGDDYWTDPMKLQLQADEMLKRPECTVSIHMGEAVDEKTGERSVIRARKGDGYISTDELIYLEPSAYPAASIMLKNIDVLEAIKARQFYGRHSMVLAYAAHGSIYYLDKCMCAYRKSVTGSWTENMRSQEAKRKHLFVMLGMFDEYNDYTNGRYSKSIGFQQSMRVLNYLAVFGKAHGLDGEQVEKLRSYLSSKGKALLRVSHAIPPVGRVLLWAMRRLKIY